MFTNLRIGSALLLVVLLLIYPVSMYGGELDDADLDPMLIEAATAPVLAPAPIQPNAPFETPLYGSNDRFISIHQYRI